ncbi:MAG: galactokinase, partial [Chloroflexi bacterium]|nr:galactokinase [Chloroflexota bacterium]
AIDLEIRIASVASGDRTVELTRLETGERLGFSLDGLAPGAPTGQWIDYPAGMAWSLGERGVAMRGLRGVVATTLPAGAGLSSSAALELASAWSLAVEVPPPLPPMDLARAAQRAENVYVGVMCGLMDQFASSHGRAGAALLFDCRSLEHRSVALPPGHLLVVCDTSAPHRLDASNAYNERRAQCEAGVELLRSRDVAVGSLRDVTVEMLEAARSELDPVVFRRCLHVVHENQRVLEVDRALREGDLTAVGRAFAASHESLRELFEVTSPELDAMVEVATSVPGVVGARMTGAGFGGSTVNLVREGAVEELRRVVGSEYPRRTGIRPAVHVVTAADGAGRVEG